MPFVPPSFNASAFNCPHCNAFSSMKWHELSYQGTRFMTSTPIKIAICTHCRNTSFWHENDHPEGSKAVDGRMLVPNATVAPLAHPDMPDEVRREYEEARNITNQSPRGAAALLRLAIQKLCIYLGGKGKNLNDDIGALVKKGLPIEIQQALDIVRVLGNNAVHPGELSADDVSTVADTLFELVNHIVEDRISRPKKLARIFENLPEGARNGILKRDS